MTATQKMVILVGAPLVLLGGIAVNAGVQKGSAVADLITGWMHELEHSPEPVVMHVGSLPVISQMHVDGAKIGHLQTVMVLRDRPGAVDSLRLLVSSAPALADVPLDCPLLFDPDAMDETWPLDGIKHVVTCGADTAGYVRFGSVVLSDLGQTLALYLEEDDLPCDHMSDPDPTMCDDIRTKMRRLRKELREEIRIETESRVRVTVEP